MSRLHRLCLFGASSAVVSICIYKWYYTNYNELKSKHKSRITNLQNDNQKEHNVNNCSVLITPCLDNCHSFDIYNDNIDQKSIDRDFNQILDKHIDWNSKIISFGMIPTQQLSLVQKYWNKHRSDKYEISYHCYTFRLNKYDHMTNNIKDISMDNIVIKPLTISDLNGVLQLNEYSASYNDYIKQVIESERVSLGVYHKNNLIACGLIHIDDLSFGGLAVDKQFRRKGIAIKLSQVVLKEHFKQGFDYVTANIELENTASLGLVNKLGFKKLEGSYYWLKQQIQ